MRHIRICCATTVMVFHAIAGFLSVIPSAAVAQHNRHGHHTGELEELEGHAGIDAFLSQAREASSRYHSLGNAIAAGYRLVGPDFPGMGEHWVNVRLVTRQTIDPHLPSVLSYLRIDGEPVLTGVAYTQTIREGEALPQFPSPEAWHFHEGSIDEETLLLNPHAMHQEEGDANVRLAMLHAWIWIENPAGIFGQDNWALSFLRLGLPVPEEAPPPQAGKALFLLAGGVDYYARLIHLAGAPVAAEEAVVRQILSSHQEGVAKIVDRGVVDAEMVERLASLWASMWADIERGVSDSLWVRIRMLAG